MAMLQLCFLCITFLSLSVTIVKTQITIEDGGIMVVCYSNTNCGGASFTTVTLDACCIHPEGNPVRLSYVRDDVESCLTCPLIFGFLNQTTFRGVERGQPHGLNIGRASGIIPGQIVIMVELRLGTGTAAPEASDVSLATNRFRFIGNAANQEVAVSHRVDAIAQEFDETYELEIVPAGPLPNGATLLPTATIVIVDADVVTFSLTEDDYREGENSEDPIQATVFKPSSISLANPVTFMVIPLTVQQALDHEDNILDTFEAENPFSPNRAAEADFDTSVIILEFPSDIDSPVNEVEAPIALKNDEIDEADVQIFIIYLRVINSTNPSLIVTDRIISQGRIVDDDPIQIGFAQQLYTFMEPDFFQIVTQVLLIKENNTISEQTFGVTVTVSAPASSTRPATLEPDTDDETIVNFDYSLTLEGNSIELQFPPNQQNISFEFFLNSDDLPEGTEGFQASSTSASSFLFPTFQSPVSSELNPNPRAYQATEIQITDNDFAVVGFEQTMYTVNETDGVLEVCVVITNPPIQEDLSFPITLTYNSMAGTADDQDFALDNTFGGIIVFPESDADIDAALRRSCFNVFITDDSISENVESFSLLLELDTFVEQSGIRVDPNATVISIIDADEVVIGFINQPYNASESDRTASVEVGIISGSLQREVSVEFSSSDSSALSTRDYNTSTETLVFNQTVTSHTIEVPLIDDDIFELNEVFIGNLVSVSDDARVTIDPDMADINIVDDDILEFGFNPDSTQVSEESGSVSLVVSLLSGDSGEFTVLLTASTFDNTMVDNQALAGLDYEETSTQLTFLPGGVDQNFDVMLINDNITEMEEIFSGALVSPILIRSGGSEITISAMEASRIRITVPMADVSIVDEDMVIIGFLSTEYSAFESGGPINFEFGVIEGELGFDVDLIFTTSDDTAIGGEDYTAVTTGRTLMAGTGSSSVSVAVISDTTLEAMEAFNGNLGPSGTLPSRVTLSPDIAVAMIIDDDMAVIGFEPADYTVDESAGTVNFTITLISGTISKDVLVEFFTNDSTAADPDDYSSFTTTLTFGSTTDSQVVSVPVIDDDVFENDEVFTGNLRFPEGFTASVVLVPMTAPATITDNDGVTIGFVRNYEIEEGSGVAVEVEVLSGMLEREVVVMVSTSDGTAGAPDDYNAVSGLLLTFSPDQLSQTFPVAALDDDALEDVEQFFAVASSDVDRVTIDPDQASISIIDTDEVTIGFVRDYDVTEGSGVNVEVAVLSGTLEREVVVMVSTSDDTAEALGDYNAVSGILLTFTPDQSTRSFNVATLDDETLEGSERFFAVASSNDDSVTVNPSQTNINILDNDGVTIGFVTDYEVPEGSVVPVEIAVLSGTLEREVVVVVSAADDSAEAPDDYNPVSDVQLTFSPGQTTQTFNVNILDDNVLEYTERLFVAAMTDDSSVTVAPDQANITILDNDGVTIGFVRDYEVTEGSVVPVEISVLSGILGREVVVIVSTVDDSAEAPDDYNPVSDVELTFSPGQTTQTFNVNILDDNVLEDATERLFVAATTDDSGVTVSPDQASITIFENDGVTIGFVRDYEVTEGSVVPVEIAVLDGILEREVVVVVSTADDSAEAPDDYNPVSDVQLTFSPNQTTQTFNVNTLDDNVLEDATERLFVAATTDDSSVTVSPDQASITILENDGVIIGFVRDYEVTEGSVVPVEISVLSGMLEREVVVMVSTSDDTAQAPGDYDAVSGSLLTFSPGQPTQTVNVTTLDDDTLENPREQFFVVASTNDPSVTIAPEQATIDILDNDEVSISFEVDSYNVVESQGPLNVTIILTGSTERDVEFILSTINRTASSIGDEIDYGTLTMLLTFPPSTSDMQVIVVPIVINDDSFVEGNETFNVMLGLPELDDPVNIDTDPLPVVIIDDDDVRIGFEDTLFEVNEDTGNVMVTVSVLDGTLRTPVEVTLSTSDGSAEGGSDYTHQGPIILTFDQDTTSAVIQVPIIDDTLVENVEEFTVDLVSQANPSVVTVSPNMAVIRITDNDIMDIGTQVNDTVIGDPLFTVPLFVNESLLESLGLEKVSLCYEVHGESEQWFNLVTDACATVNARYVGLTESLNVIDEIGVRAVNDDNECVNIRVDINGCSAEVNDVALNLNQRYSSAGISVRRYNNRVRISVPNCNELTLVMWVFCETRTLDNPDVPGTTLTADMIKFVVMRGLNFGHRAAHGLLGQFWNAPATIAPYTGNLVDGSPAMNVYTVNITTNGDFRAFAGWIHSVTWDFEEGPCIYVGNKQSGPLFEVPAPNDDAVIESLYNDYRVSDAFSEEEYTFGLFQEDLCTATPAPETTASPIFIPEPDNN